MLTLASRTTRRPDGPPLGIIAKKRQTVDPGPLAAVPATSGIAIVATNNATEDARLL